MDDDYSQGANLHVRAEDFRNAWPHALARSMHAASELLDRIEAIGSAQVAHQDRLEVLGSKMPKAIRAAEDLLTQRGLVLGQVVDASVERALDNIAALSAQVEHDIQSAGTQMRQEAVILVAAQQRFTQGLELLISNFNRERMDQKTLSDLVAKQSEELGQLRQQVQKVQLEAQAPKEARHGFFQRLLNRLGWVDQS